GGHERRPSASPQPAKTSDLSPLLEWGHRQRHSVDAPGKMLRPLWDSLFVAFPALSIAGIVATVIVNRASLATLWFFLVFLSLPYVSIVFFARESNGARVSGLFLRIHIVRLPNRACISAC